MSEYIEPTAEQLKARIEELEFELMMAAVTIREYAHPAGSIESPSLVRAYQRIERVLGRKLE